MWNTVGKVMCEWALTLERRGWKRLGYMVWRAWDIADLRVYRWQNRR